MRDSCSRRKDVRKRNTPHAPLKQLFDAIRGGDAGAIERLLRDDPALLETRDERGFTPLQTAAWQSRKEQREEIVRLLIDKGAQVDIHVACTLDMADRVEALLREEPTLLHET